MMIIILNVLKLSVTLSNKRWNWNNSFILMNNIINRYSLNTSGTKLRYKSLIKIINKRRRYYSLPVNLMLSL